MDISGSDKSPETTTATDDSRSDDTGGPGTADTQSWIKRVAGILVQSPTGRALWEFAQSSGMKLGIDPNIETDAFYAPNGGPGGENGTVVLAMPRAGDPQHEAVEEAQAVLALARELRRHWNLKHGRWMMPQLQPSFNLLVNRMQSADVMTCSLQVAAELSSDSIGWPNALQFYAQTAHADMAQAYIGQVRKDAASVANGRAMRAAYDQFFMVEARRKAVDEETITALEAGMHNFDADEPGQPVGLPQNVLEGFGYMPKADGAEEGVNYLVDHPLLQPADAFYTSGIALEHQLRIAHLERYLQSLRFTAESRDTGQAIGVNIKDQPPRDGRPPAGPAPMLPPGISLPPGLAPR